MTPEDLFAAFFGGGPVFHQHQRPLEQSLSEGGGRVLREGILTQAFDGSSSLTKPSSYDVDNQDCGG